MEKCPVIFALNVFLVTSSVGLEKEQPKITTQKRTIVTNQTSTNEKPKLGTEEIKR